MVTKNAAHAPTVLMVRAYQMETFPLTAQEFDDFPYSPDYEGKSLTTSGRADMCVYVNKIKQSKKQAYSEHICKYFQGQLSVHISASDNVSHLSQGWGS